MCASIPCTNKRPGCDDMIDKITCFGNDGMSIMDCKHYLIDLNYFISFIHKSKCSKSNCFFSTLKRGETGISILPFNYYMTKIWHV